MSHDDRNIVGDHVSQRKDRKESKDRNGSSMAALMTSPTLAAQQLKAVIHDGESFFLDAY